MKLKYIGPREYITLHEVKNPDGGMGIRANKNQSFECSSLVASQLLSKNKQHVRPIFEEATESEDIDILKDFEVPENKMLAKPKKTK